MSFAKNKRIWETVSTRPCESGFEILLDDRPVRTPARSALLIPTISLAQKIAEEWDAQADIIDPISMPLTRTANSAIDKVAPQKIEVGKMLSAYGDSDLLCYRAGSPTNLVARQNAAWNPILDWAAETLGARLQLRIGVIHVPQDNAVNNRLEERVHALSVFELAAFHDMVSLTGSLILAFATIYCFCDAVQAWQVSRIDETWQIEQWGEDDEATALSSVKQKSFYDAELFFKLVQEKY
ncbi:MAG: ATP12 family chaperone protein [Paracoccaceae bacterium]